MFFPVAVSPRFSDFTKQRKKQRDNKGIDKISALRDKLWTTEKKNYLLQTFKVPLIYYFIIVKFPTCDIMVMSAANSLKVTHIEFIKSRRPRN